MLALLALLLEFLHYLDKKMNKCDFCGKDSPFLKTKTIEAENQYDLPTIPFEQSVHYCSKIECTIKAIRWNGDFS